MNKEFNENDLNNVLGGVNRELGEERLSRLFKEKEVTDKKELEPDELSEEDLDKFLGGIPQEAYQDEEFMENHR